MDGGESWSELSREAWWSVAFAPTEANSVGAREPDAGGVPAVVAWLAGPDGRLERVVF
jgi:hypothetical protein